MSMTHPEPRLSVPRVSLKAIRDSDDEHQTQPTINVGQVERWASGIGGGLLIVQGLRRGNFSGLALAILGGAFAYRGFTGHCQAYQALDINTAGKPRSDQEEAIYSGWSSTVARSTGLPPRFTSFSRNLRTTRSTRKGSSRSPSRPTAIGTGRSKDHSARPGGLTPSGSPKNRDT